MDKAFNARELVEFDIGPIVFDPLHRSDDEVSHFGKDDLRSLGRHSPGLFLAQRLQNFATNLGLSTRRLGQQLVTDCAFDIAAGSLKDNLFIGAFQALYSKEYASRFWN